MKGVDTTFLIDLLKGDQAAAKKARELDGEPLVFTTQINVFEIYRGVYRLAPAQRQRHLALLHSLMDGFHLLDLNHQASLKAARISGELMRRGITLDGGDTLIAGILLTNGCDTIVTNDKHFERIEEIIIENY